MNLNILDIMCDGSDNIKEQCSCISIVVPSKKEWFGKKNSKQQEGYYRDLCFSLACSSKMRNLK